jgi:thymidylate synthase
MIDHQILDLAHQIVLHPDSRCNREDTRSGVPHSSIFGAKITWLCENGVPLTRARKAYPQSCMKELLAFLNASENGMTAKDFMEQECSIWEPWNDDKTATFSYGKIYGSQWNRKNHLANLIDNLSTSRQQVVCSWNQDDIAGMRLPPCHFAFQFHKSSDGKLSITWFQRSCDVLIGLPFNALSYYYLLQLVCLYTGLQPYKVTGLISDAHVYDNQLLGLRAWDAENTSMRYDTRYNTHYAPVTLTILKSKDELFEPGLGFKLKPRQGSFSDWFKQTFEFSSYTPGKDIPIEVTV